MCKSKVLIAELHNNTAPATNTEEEKLPTILGPIFFPDVITRSCFPGFDF